MSSLSTLLLGLALGLRHATDPDHVVAMGTIVTRDHHVRRAVSTGMFWGIGHTMTVLAVGLLMLLGGVRVPERAAAAMELLVAAMLVTLGIVAVRSRRPAECGAERSRLPEKLLVSPLRPLVVGIVHGLAGSAATALLALATIPDARGALLYLLLFGLGTVLGMATITALLAMSLRWVGSRSARVPVWIARVSGSVSVGAGILVAVRVLVLR